MDKSLKFKEKITGYGYDGEGVCRINGKVCFVPFALKGEEVELCIVKDTSSFSKGEVVNVLKKSDQRTDPPCLYFGKCGGCTYQHTTHENELAIKKEMLSSQLKKVGFLKDIHVFESPEEYKYRNKIKLFVGNGKIGFKQRGSNNICDIEKCLIASEAINKTLQPIKTFLKAQKLFGLYEQIVIRSEGSECIINFFINKKVKINYQGLYLMLGRDCGIYETFKGQSEHKIGKVFLNFNAYGLDCEFSVGAFHQINTEVEKVLYEEVVRSIKGNNIINCYSGGGVLSGILAKKKLFVTGIELGENEHNEAEKLKEQNGLFYLRNIMGDCAEMLPKVSDKEDCVIVDPPRSGMSKDVVEALNKSRAKRLIYVSCNSATFVRDAKLLESYILKEVKLFDMFPRTGEYEILSIFDKK